MAETGFFFSQNNLFRPKLPILDEKCALAEIQKLEKAEIPKSKQASAKTKPKQDSVDH